MTKQDFIKKWMPWVSYVDREKLTKEMEADLELVAQSKNKRCQCTQDDTTGETSVMCCNNCGKPTEGFWVKAT